MPVRDKEAVAGFSVKEWLNKSKAKSYPLELKNALTATTTGLARNVATSLAIWALLPAYSGYAVINCVKNSSLLTTSEFLLCGIAANSLWLFRKVLTSFLSVGEIFANLALYSAKSCCLIFAQSSSVRRTIVLLYCDVVELAKAVSDIEKIAHNAIIIAIDFLTKYFI